MLTRGTKDCLPDITQRPHVLHVDGHAHDRRLAHGAACLRVRGVPLRGQSFDAFRPSESPTGSVDFYGVRRYNRIPSTVSCLKLSAARPFEWNRHD
jgi:hypothetical protein